MIGRAYHCPRERGTGDEHEAVSFEDVLHEAHAALSELAWKRAYSRFADASGAGDLPLSDIESFAVAAHLVGRDARGP